MSQSSHQLAKVWSFFNLEACGVLAPLPGVESTPPVLEGEVLITTSPGKSSLNLNCNFPINSKGHDIA